MDGLELIQAYRSYFNHDYNQLKSSVSKLDSLISALCGDAVADRLMVGFDTASTIIKGWRDYRELSLPSLNESSLKLSLESIKHFLEELKLAKESNLLDAIGSENDETLIIEQWNVILEQIEGCNEIIGSSINLINDYKAGLATVNITSLTQEIDRLNLSKKRYQQDVLNLLTNLNDAEAAENFAKVEKLDKKKALNRIMQATLENYKDRINELLRSFGAQFAIPNINFDYRGGLRSNYGLEMRGTNIALTGGAPDFKTSLSEGDKRSLAFAFFIASAEGAPDLNTKIVVIDDPMCSLDLNRKQQTRMVLKRIYDQCKQLIILAHDVHFIRKLRDEILKPKEVSLNDIKCLKLKPVTNHYSNFDNIDLDQECESGYFKCHRKLSEFMEGSAPSSMEVARSIRPMLEGYLHRRFPGMIEGGTMFGAVIQQVNNAQTPSPLSHARNIAGELNDINSYAGQFHHDTNPAADHIEIVDSELLHYVERAIKVVHAGVA